MEGIPASVSKSMGRVQEKTHLGASGQWWTIFISWITVSMGLIYPVASRTIVPPYTFIIYFGLILFWGIFVLYFRDTPTQKHTYLHLKFLYRSFTWKTVTMKYVAPLRFLEDIVPLLNVYDHGIIGFKHDYYGTIMRVSSSRIDDDSLSKHLALIRKVLDSLHDDITLTVLSSSFIDHKKDLQSRILELSNQKGKSAPQREHLNELYRELEQDDSYVINWNVSIFVDLGRHDTPEDAEIRRQEFMPGFIDALMKAGAYCVPIEDENDIAKVYRNMVMVR